MKVVIYNTIDLIHKWRPIYYYFIFMLNSPLGFVSTCKSNKKFYDSGVSEDGSRRANCFAVSWIVCLQKDAFNIAHKLTLWTAGKSRP